ncbi:MAG: glycosyltransferase [Solirubrobacteraceae bacterium]
MSSLSTAIASGQAEADGSGAPERPRVCMFVYNNCAADMRVHKEARSLVAAGYEVQVVAVLDKNTVPSQDHPWGFKIVRIDRDPVHYRILRRTRQTRRSIRLRRARLKRFARTRRNRTRHRLRRVARRLTRRNGLTHAGRLLKRLLQVPLALLLVLGVVPVRLGRAVRWRLLHRFPALRRPYYRMRSRHIGSLRRRRYRQRLKAGFAAYASPEAGADEAPSPSGRRLNWGVLSPAAGLGASVRQRFPRTPMAPLRRLAAWTDRKVSRAAYRGLMFFHKPLMFTAYYRKAYRLVKGEPIAVAHAHDLNTLPVAALLAMRSGCRLVYDAHELYSEISTLSKRERRIWRMLERRLIRRADVVVTVCQSIAGELVQRSHIASPPVILLNCPLAASAPPSWDGETDLLRAKAGLQGSEEPIVLYQGGFSPNRGLEELVHAAPYLERGIVVLMGWGNMEERLRELVGELELEQRVRIIGPAEQHELLSFTMGADVGVIPYKAVGLNNYYTTPNKLFEYMLAGVAIAGSRVPELRRFVEGHGLGITFDPDDPRDIALAINFLLADPIQLREMRQHSREAARQYVWENEVPKLVSAYQSLNLRTHAALPVPARGG